MKRTRRRFTAEFKQEAVRLVRERGVSIAQAARELEIHDNVLRTWLRAVDEDAAHPFRASASRSPSRRRLRAYSAKSRG